MGMTRQQKDNLKNLDLSLQRSLTLRIIITILWYVSWILTQNIRKNIISQIQDIFIIIPCGILINYGGHNKNTFTWAEWIFKKTFMLKLRL